MPRKIKRSRSKKQGASGMMQQLQSLQQDVVKAQEELAEATVTATAGGGMVEAIITGERRVQSITIKPEVVDPEDIEMLQDLVMAAINEGLERVDQEAADRMAEVTGGLSELGVPGLG